MDADIEAIVALYASHAVYRSHPHRDPEVGGARGFITRTFAEESKVECRFCEPIVDGDRATVEWSATYDEGDRSVLLSGVTLLRFDDAGLVVDHLDYWAELTR